MRQDSSQRFPPHSMMGSGLMVVALGLLYGGALVTGPIRRWLVAEYESLGFVAAADSIVPILALAFAIGILLLRGRLYPSREFKVYAVCGSLTSFVFVLGELLRVTTVDIFAHILVLNIVASVMWYGVLAPRERRVLFRWAVATFFIYLAVNLVYWAIFLDPLGTPSAGVPYRRMGGSLAGIVDLGVMIPAVSAYFLAGSENNRPNRGYLRPLAIVVALAALVATASRVGIGLMGVLLGMRSFSSPSQTRALRAWGAAMLVGGVALALSGFAVDYRYFAWDLVSEGRLPTWHASVSHWWGSDVLGLLFGSGWGGTYPYWGWAKAGGDTFGGHNWFSLGWAHSLVSPHNSLLWVLVEGGALTAIGLLGILIYPLVRVLVAKGLPSRQLVSLGSASLVLMCLISDTLVTAPGTSFLALFLLLLSPTSSLGAR